MLRIRDSVDEVLPLTSPERQIKGRQLMDKFLTTDKKNGQSVNKLGISPENYKNIKPHPQTASPFSNMPIKTTYFSIPAKNSKKSKNNFFRI